MTKTAYHFPHDFNARRDLKIMDMMCDYEIAGFGLYFWLIETLCEQQDYTLQKDKRTLRVLAKSLNLPEEYLNKFVDDCIEVYDLFKTDGVTFWSESLKRRLSPLDEIREKRSKAGKKSAEARKKQTDEIEQNSTSVEQVLKCVETKANTCSTEKEREKERKKERHKDIKKEKDDVSFPSGNSIVNDDVMTSERLNDTFEALWKIYPTQLNKRGKKNECLELFVSLNLDQQECNKILINTNKLKQTENWLKENGRFIPKLIDYIDNARWNDYIEETTNQFNRERLPMTLQEIEANLSKEDIEQLKENGRKAELEKQRLLNEHRY